MPGTAKLHRVLAARPESTGQPRARWKQLASQGGTSEQMICIGGLVEKVTLGTTVSWKHYIAGGAGPVAVCTRKSASFTATRDEECHVYDA